MRRPIAGSGDMPGSDSFLDVVANMVGILIILVMIVSARAKQMPADAAEAPPTVEISPEKVLNPLVAESNSLQTDVKRLAAQSYQLQMDLANRVDQRDEMSLLAARMEEELAKQREKLEGSSQADFDLRRAFNEARTQLDSLQQQRDAIQMAPPSQIKVQSLPTPISKTVHGQELHFQLRGGRVQFIPLDELLDTFKETARHKIWKLEDTALMTDTIGPIGGFRMRYEIGRFEISGEEARQAGRGGTVIRLVKWELLPVTLELGETADEALKPGSEFLKTFERKDPSRVTITLWTYPDSFETFRRLKAHLHAGGFAAAGRPLPEDQPIGGSPDGTRSAAQ